MKPINVVVGDSSPAVCRLLKSHLESVPDIRVTGVAQRGQEVLNLIAQQPPDVVTLGLELPDMNGVETLKVIQQMRATPTIIISGANLRAATRTVEALQHGAVDFVFKFLPGAAQAPDALGREIISKVRIAARLNAAQLTADSIAPTLGAGTLWLQTQPPTTPPKPRLRSLASDGKSPEKVIVAGASTGGPVALRQLLSQIPPDFSGSILIVQHLPPSFTAVLAEQLNEQLPLPVKEAQAGSTLEGGTVFITPGQFNVQISAAGEFQLLDPEEAQGHCPSINVTMQSVAARYGAKARGVLLTGMGNDGVAGLSAIRQHGGTTFVQSLDTCTAPGMPQRAIEAGLADHVAAPDKIAQLLLLGY